ncbi:hypothetical protein AB1Y20_006935 [Prymnesium parvum]
MPVSELALSLSRDVSDEEAAFVGEATAAGSDTLRGNGRSRPAKNGAVLASSSEVAGCATMEGGGQRLGFANMSEASATTDDLLRVAPPPSDSAAGSLEGEADEGTNHSAEERLTFGNVTIGARRGEMTDGLMAGAQTASSASSAASTTVSSMMVPTPVTSAGGLEILEADLWRPVGPRLLQDHSLDDALSRRDHAAACSASDSDPLSSSSGEYSLVSPLRAALRRWGSGARRASWTKRCGAVAEAHASERARRRARRVLDLWRRWAARESELEAEHTEALRLALRRWAKGASRATRAEGLGAVADARLRALSERRMRWAFAQWAARTAAAKLRTHSHTLSRVTRRLALRRWANGARRAMREEGLGAVADAQVRALSERRMRWAFARWRGEAAARARRHRHAHAHAQRRLALQRWAECGTRAMQARREVAVAAVHMRTRSERRMRWAFAQWAARTAAAAKVRTHSHTLSRVSRRLALRRWANGASSEMREEGLGAVADAQVRALSERRMRWAFARWRGEAAAAARARRHRHANAHAQRRLALQRWAECGTRAMQTHFEGAVAAAHTRTRSERRMRWAFIRWRDETASRLKRARMQRRAHSRWARRIALRRWAGAARRASSAVRRGAAASAHAHARLMRRVRGALMRWGQSCTVGRELLALQRRVHVGERWLFRRWVSFSRRRAVSSVAAANAVAVYIATKHHRVAVVRRVWHSLRRATIRPTAGSVDAFPLAQEPHHRVMHDLPRRASVESDARRDTCLTSACGPSGDGSVSKTLLTQTAGSDGPLEGDEAAASHAVKSAHRSSAKWGLADVDAASCASSLHGVPPTKDFGCNVTCMLRGNSVLETSDAPSSVCGQEDGTSTTKRHPRGENPVGPSAPDILHQQVSTAREAELAAELKRMQQLQHELKRIRADVASKGIVRAHDVSQMKVLSSKFDAERRQQQHLAKDMLLLTHNLGLDAIGQISGPSYYLSQQITKPSASGSSTGFHIRDEWKMAAEHLPAAFRY